MQERTIRLGIVGMGAIFDHQAAALDLSEGYELVALCDVDPSKRDKKPGTPFFSSLDTFLQQDLDAVMISVPVADHFEVCARALESGVPVMQEKPATLSMEQFERLAGIADRTGASLSIAVHASYGPELLWFERRLAEGGFGELGPVTAVRGQFYDPYMSGGTVMDRFAGLGGSWMDSGINGLSVLSRLVDMSSVMFERADRTVLPGATVHEIQCASHYRFPAGTGNMAGWAVIDTNWSLGKNLKMTEVFYHQQGVSFLLHHSRQAVYRRTPSGKLAMMADCSGGLERLCNHYRELFAEYRRSLAEGRSNLQEMLRLHRLFFSVYQQDNNQ